MQADRTSAQDGLGWKQRAALTRADWNIHLPFFKELYIDEQRTLDNVMRLMKEKLDFVATKKMYKTHFKRLGLSKTRQTTTGKHCLSATAAIYRSPMTRDIHVFSAQTLDQSSETAAVLKIAGYNVLVRPGRSLSTPGVDGRAEALLWHVAVCSESWLEARRSSPLPVTRTSGTWNMLDGQSAASLSLFDVRQGLQVLDQTCALVDKVMSQRHDNLLPIMLVQFYSTWWLDFADVRRSLLRYLTKLAGTRLGSRHHLTVIFFQLMDENVSARCMDVAFQIVINTAQRELPLPDQSALSLKHAYCCMLIDRGQFSAAMAPVTELRNEAWKSYGARGILARCALMRQGEIHLGLEAVGNARTSYEEALQLSEGEYGHDALDAVGVEAATRLARLYLTSGEASIADQLCKKALKNPWTPFSKPGLKGAGRTLKIMLEETWVSAKNFLGGHGQRTQCFACPGANQLEAHNDQSATAKGPDSNNLHDDTGTRASLTNSPGCLSTDPGISSEFLAIRSTRDQDPLVMKHDFIVRSGGGGDRRPYATFGRPIIPPGA